MTHEVFGWEVYGLPRLEPVVIFFFNTGNIFFPNVIKKLFFFYKIYYFPLGNF